MNMFTSTFGEQYRHSNPNDPNNLGEFDKRLFRNNVRFQKDFKQYGSLRLSAADVPYNDSLLLWSFVINQVLNVPKCSNKW